MNRLALAFLAALLLTAPAAAESVAERFDRFGPVITAAAIPANHFNVRRIELLWSPAPREPGDSADTRVLWRVDAIRPVDFRGLNFTLYRQPPGFRTLTLHQAPGPTYGVYTLSVRRAEPTGPSQGFRIDMSPRQAAALMPETPKL